MLTQIKFQVSSITCGHVPTNVCSIIIVHLFNTLIQGWRQVASTNEACFFFFFLIYLKKF